MKNGQTKKTKKPAPKPVIGKLIRITAGRRHGIFEAELAGTKFEVRKPL